MLRTSREAGVLLKVTSKQTYHISELQFENTLFNTSTIVIYSKNGRSLVSPEFYDEKSKIYPLLKTHFRRMLEDVVDQNEFTRSLRNPSTTSESCKYVRRYRYISLDYFRHILSMIFSKSRNVVDLNIFMSK